MPLSRRLPRRDAQCAAARLLRALPARARRARARRRGARGRRQPVGLGLHAGGASPSPRLRGRWRGREGPTDEGPCRRRSPSSVAFGDTFSREREKGAPPPPPRLDGRAHPRDACRAARLSPDHRRQAKTTCASSSRRAGRATIRCAISGCALASSPAALERLADADAFRSLGLDRREALWAVRGLDRVGDQDDLPLFALSRPERDGEPDARLPPMPLGAHVVEDYRRLSLSLKAHPVAFMRARLDARGVKRAEALATLDERRARHRRRPGAGAPAPRHGQGRDLHDARGRDGRRQSDRLAEGVRAAARHRHRRALRRRDRQTAERIRRRASHRRAHGGSDADARPALRARTRHRNARHPPTKCAARK